MIYTDELKRRFLYWLQPQGIAFFKGLIEKYDTVLASWNEGTQTDPIPHVVHFREGMQIRNWMRAQAEFAPKREDDIWLDDNWHIFVCECLEMVTEDFVLKVQTPPDTTIH